MVVDVLTREKKRFEKDLGAWVKRDLSGGDDVPSFQNETYAGRGLPITAEVVAGASPCPASWEGESRVSVVLVHSQTAFEPWHLLFCIPPFLNRLVLPR